MSQISIVVAGLTTAFVIFPPPERLEIVLLQTRFEIHVDGPRWHRISTRLTVTEPCNPSAMREQRPGELKYRYCEDHVH